MSAHAVLRATTAGQHALIDVALSRFDLTDRNSYVKFLLAHAAVLPPIEKALAADSSLPPWRARTEALKLDLASFGHGMPPPLSIEMSSLAEKFGLLYVIEGSRLGGRLLLSRVAPAFSSNYLGAIHEPGEWRAFIDALEERASAEHSGWLDCVAVGAGRGFQLYAESVARVLASSNPKPS
jgi:heme oxygenase (biliverdin-IX-beta and delta-forming)